MIASMLCLHDNAVNHIIREMHADEYPLLENFLYEAVFQQPGSLLPSRNIIHLPALYAYIENFGGRKGDLCLCAEVNDVVAGAVWGRLMHGFGHVDDGTPELAVSVLPTYRGRGLGTAMLGAMLNALGREGYRAVSLSVQKANPACRLYRRLGFRIVHEHDEEYVMVRGL